MVEVVQNFIKNYQEGNSILFILAIIAISIALGIYVIVILGTRNANKIIYEKEMESTRLILNNIFANISKRISRNIDISEEEAVVYVFAGEQNYKTYQRLVPILKNFLDKVLEKTKKIKIISVAGKKLMVKKLINDLTEIHPSMKLISDEKYKEHIEFYIVRDSRLPYHFFYSSLAESGVAEVPHRELSTPMNWMFKNKKEYKTLFHNWYRLLREKYDMNLFFFKGKDLYFRNVLTGVESKLENKHELFFLKSIFLKVKTFFQNETLTQCAYHSDKTSLLMRNWHPFSDNLFTQENKKILSSL